MIRLRDVTFYYPGSQRPALEGISLEIGQGDFVGVMGHSGAGKTTLAKLMAGLLKPTRGTVEIFGVDSRKLRASELAKQVAYVPQDPESALFSRTIYEEFMVGLRHLKLAPSEVEERIRKAMEAVDLKKSLDQSPHTLSFGEKHRLVIALALAMKPRVLILDEPFAGLDYARSRMLLQQCTQIARSGGAVILIAHDVQLIAEFANRVVVLDSGKKVFDGRPEDFFIDLELLEKLSIIPPQLSTLRRELARLGLIDEAFRGVRLEDYANLLESLVKKRGQI